jgi:putative lipoprotein
MRRLGPALVLALTACTGGTAASGPATAPEPTPASAPTPPAPVVPPAGPEERIEDPGPRTTLIGTVTYLPRIALTPQAVVQVELRDVSSQDTEAPLIAKQVIQRPGQVPIAFALEYDPSAILPGHLYAISARISDRGQLQFVTDTPIPVLGSGATGTVEILVVPIR